MALLTLIFRLLTSRTVREPISVLLSDLICLMLSLKVEPTGFADDMNIGCGRKRKVWPEQL